MYGTPLITKIQQLKNQNEDMHAETAQKLSNGEITRKFIQFPAQHEPCSFEQFENIIDLTGKIKQL